jgi:acetyl-CoA carboxylase biotin carboxyl carrier protein
MDYRAIQELIKTMSDSKLTTLEIESDGICIKMGKEEIVSVKASPQAIVESNSDEVINKADEAAVTNNKEVKTIEVLEQSDVQEDNKTVVEDDINIEIVVSPIVGTFYESPAPDSEPFVKVGSKVKAGDTLCIVEAMKLMNDITSEVEGEIVEILVKNEEMVEYGQPLFKCRAKRSV